MPKLLAALLAALCCLCMTSCASANLDTYEYAERALGEGDYNAAAILFGQLGEYRDAADYRLYAEALDALANGSLDIARANFELLAPFKSSERYLACIDAVEMDRAGETGEALAIYERLGTFAEAHLRAAELREELAAQPPAATTAPPSAAPTDSAAADVARQYAKALHSLLAAGMTGLEKASPPPLTPVPTALMDPTEAPAATAVAPSIFRLDVDDPALPALTLNPAAHDVAEPVQHRAE